MSTTPESNAVAEYRARTDQHVYVVAFDSDVVKVGRAKSATSRLHQHAKDARNHGHSITAQWVSPRHQAYKENEAALISFCSEHWAASSGKEYFAGADFDSVVEYAQGLRYMPTPIDEVSRQLAKHSAISEAWESDRAARMATAELRDITERAELIRSLANDVNREQTSGAVFELAKRAMAMTAPAWSDSDPMAAEQYLISRGAKRETAAKNAAEFELSFRALYALRFLADPSTFEDLARFADEVST